MHYKIIFSLVNYDLAQAYVPAIKSGQFSIVNKTFATFQSETAASKCDLEFRTDFILAGANKRIEYNDSATNYSGYNNQYIDVNGTLTLATPVLVVKTRR